MIYKVLYQENPDEIPVREHTKSLYLEAESEKDVRIKLKERNINIEFIQLLNEAHLEYEKNSPDFKVETA
ncbi:DNA-dependent RNA polymerase auxiliary subunit epsilon [Gracilibacillus halotolerans]|uniref:DNA-directed RNA polymerase subunit epsilon n=1 Tax=Gracilibacillus halotolerans TaxID=74386 RepID=A0A841RI23_9BACI|nr:DNA-directed RNA polymerase subunit epsilon [Gracilibacillus halotolerans]MBB6511303.1 DNA-dependent RNA polymerase auxiliary subunit epsilon [Gracilibacillus halotolerans]